MVTIEEEEEEESQLKQTQPNYDEFQQKVVPAFSVKDNVGCILANQVSHVALYPSKKMGTVNEVLA